MMPVAIQVHELQGRSSAYEVKLEEGGSATTHQVTVGDDLYRRLTGGKTPREACVKAAFRFLLDREPKESILGRFDLSLISKYFPEFESEFANHLR